MKRFSILKISIMCIAFIFISLLLADKPVFAEQTSGLVNGMIYNLQNKNSGKYLNVNLASDANGTNVNQWTNDGSIEQKFRLVYMDTRDCYKLHAMCSSKGGNRVLDVLRVNGSASGNIVSGGNIDIWTPNDNDAQDFKIVDEGNGYYSIRLRINNNLAVTAYDKSNGSGAGNTSTSAGNVYISTWNGSNKQLWNFIEVFGTPAAPYRHAYGLSNVPYYVHSTATGYNSFISGGSTRWNPTITFTQVTNHSDSVVDYYGVHNDYLDNQIEMGTKWLAVTVRYRNNSSTPVPTNEGANWDYAEIYINNDYFYTNEINDDKRTGTIAHEIGHAFGLWHTDNLNSIMIRDAVIRQVTTPQNIDRTAINYKY